jgi:hypothetical protein
MMPSEEPEDEQLEVEAQERASDEGMLPPDEEPGTRGDLGRDGADVSGTVPGDD